MYICSLDRMNEKINTFSRFGATDGGGITRYSLSEAAICARNEFIHRMIKIGAKIENDDMGNIYATLDGNNQNAKRIVMGSHVDSVKNGGNYDGILGVLTAMEVLETTVEQNIEHIHPLTAMIWTNEEGSLYPPAMMSSGVVCNHFLPEAIGQNFRKEDMLMSKSILEPLKTFGEALQQSGFAGEESNRLNPERYLCMLETHIEQGPILEENGNEIGVVDCVLGMFNYRIKLRGQAAHAGTFPMKRRKDALFAASSVICYLHEAIDALGHEDLVYTTGEIVCHPCVHTVIPDYVEFSLDVRHEKPEVLAAVLRIIEKMTEREWCGCSLSIEQAWKRDTVYWNEELVKCVLETAKDLGVKHQYIHSGAGHDAQFVSYMLPTTMIFVQTKAGLSHCEEEYAKPEHCTSAANIMLNTVLKLDQRCSFS